MMLIKDDPFSTILLLRNKLAELGYKNEAFKIEGKQYTRFIAPNGRVWLTRSAMIAYPFINATVSSVCSNKNIAYELASQAGVTVPYTLEVAKGEANEQQLQEMLDKYAKVIVKPSNSSLSHGLTLNITSLKDMQAALEAAYVYSDRALVQQQVYGEEIRFAVVEGKVVSALLRRTAHVVGDGTSTVKELIAAENEQRTRIETPYVTYPQLDGQVIPAHFLEDTRVLVEGEILELAKGTMIKTGASIYDIIDQVHPLYIDTVEKLVAQLGAGFVVVDIFIQDYAQPQTDDNYAFIEFNTAPVLKLFYSCRDGKMTDILAALVPLIDKTIAGHR
jgi:D-alanine-D-alanine ligase-like ATP-grasp enzyme